VVWDQLDAAEAHGLSATYHEVVTAEVAGLREGDLSLVQPSGVDGERLRATLLHP
jgi:hypothetical protein